MSPETEELLMDPESLVDSFRTWVREQPAERVYPYCAPRRCALALFLRESMGLEDVLVRGFHFSVGNRNYRIPEELTIHLVRNNTMGGLALALGR
jgi:hypothetical protein